jgi:uncharacterized membrane protein YhhN
MPFIPYLLVTFLHLYSKLVADEALDTFTKPLLMPVLLVGVLFALPAWRSRIALLLAIALAFSWLGDVSLLYSGNVGFLTGLGFFLLAHVAYLVLLAGIRRRPLHWGMAVYAVWWVGLVLLLAPHLGVLLVPVAVYGLVLGAMAAWALLGNRWVAVGGALFLISDTLLGLNRFLPGFVFPEVDFTIMLTYTAGQALIAWGAVVFVRSRTEALQPPAIRQ